MLSKKFVKILTFLNSCLQKNRVWSVLTSHASSYMSERRKFTRQLISRGSASQLRESASTAVQDQISSNLPKLVEPLDYETHIQKNRTILYNDPQRELVLFPADDVQTKVVPRNPRTKGNSVPESVHPEASRDQVQVTNHLARQSINFYTSDWHIVKYKYEKYGSGYEKLCREQLEKIKKLLPQQKFEVDEEDDGKTFLQVRSVVIQGWLYAGPEKVTESLTSSNFSKLFKRRYCCLKKMHDGSHIMEEFRDDKKQEQTRESIFMDSADTVVVPALGTNTAAGRNLFELKMMASRSYIFAAETSTEQQQWMAALHRILHPSNAPLPPNTQTQNESSPAAYNESVRKCLTKYSQESERSISSLRNKAHQKILFLYPDLHNSSSEKHRYLPGEDPVLSHREEVSAEEKAPFSEQSEATRRFRVTCTQFQTLLEAELEIDGNRVRDNPEPFFLTLCLINVREGRKVSEDFMWNPNSPVISSTIPKSLFNRKSSQQEITHHEDAHVTNPIEYQQLASCDTCIFSVTSSEIPDIYLLIRVEKVLSGGISQSVEKYMKGADPRSGFAVHKNMQACCMNIGHYRMPFGWTARSLRTPTNDPNLKLYKMESSKLSEEDLIKLVQNINRPEKSGKWVSIPCRFQVLVEELKYGIHLAPDRCSVVGIVPENQQPLLLSSTLEAVLPIDEQHEKKTMPGPVIREVEEFLQEGRGAEAYAAPYLSYFNTLYIYPRCLNYSGQSHFPRARNLSCFVELRDSDDEVYSRSHKDSTSSTNSDDLNGACLKIFYSRPSPYQGSFSSWVNTSVSHHDTSPNFNDEFKICLPSNLTRKHHLLFRFFHVSCETASSVPTRDKNAGKRHMEMSVGYAWIPLLDKDGKVNTGDFPMPVSVNLPSGYLDFRANETLQARSSDSLTRRKTVQGPQVPNSQSGSTFQWVENGKELFRVILRLRSSIFTRDQHLHKFFSCCGSGLVNPPTPSAPLQIPSETYNMNNLLKSLLAVDLPTVISFLPVLFDQLLQIVTFTQEDSVAQTAIEVLVWILALMTNKATDKIEVKTKVMDNYKNVLKAYVKFSFFGDNIAVTRSRTVHEELVRHAFSLLKPGNMDNQAVSRFLGNLWFFLELISKSMSQHLLSSSRIKMNRHERFSNDFKIRLKNFFFALVSHISNGVKKFRKEDMQQANTSLANFVRRLLSLSDRGFVFQLVHQYYSDLQAAESSENWTMKDKEELRRMKYTFLKVICNHEHYVQLNLPSSKFAIMKDIRSEFFLTADFCYRHYLVGLMLLQLNHALLEGSHDVRKLAIRVVRDILAKHAADDRHQSRAHQTRITSLYLPLLNLILENKVVFQELNISGASQEGPGALGVQHRSNSLTSVSTAPTISSRVERPPSYAPSDGGISTSSASIHSGGSGKGNSLSRTSTYTNQSHNGKVDTDILNQIAGVGPGGSLSGLIPGVTNLVQARGSDWGQSTGSGGTFSGSTSTLGCGVPTRGNRTATGSNSTLTGIGEDMIDNSSEQLMDSSASVYRHRICKHEKLQDKDQQDLLVCFLHVLTTVGDDVLSAWLNNLSLNDRGDFFDILLICLRQFKYRGKSAISKLQMISRGDVHTKRGSQVASGIISGGSGRFRIHTRNSAHLMDTAPSLPENGDRIDGSNTRSSSEHNIVRKLSLCAQILRRAPENCTDSAVEMRSLMEANLSTEVGLIVLDVICLYCDQFKGDLLSEGGDHPIFRRLLEVLLCFLKTNQSESLLQHVFSALRVFISRFARCLFTGGTASGCGNICYVVLRCCNSKLDSIRMEACGLLYRLMRIAHEINGRVGFTRVHLQMIISVSRLVSDVNSLNSIRFQSSLSFLNSLAQSDRSLQRTGSSFVEEVKDLTKRIRTVLMATAQMREHENDPEMLVDLKYSLAQSYATTPALRKTWLDSMAKVHTEHNNLSEVAHCKIHVAALVAEYLKRRGQYPQGCTAFAPISPNIASEESGIRDDTGMLDEQYSEHDLVRLLEEAFSAFEASERWEVMAHIAHLLEPIYLRNRLFEELHEMHEKLAKGYGSIINAKRRFLGTFYRVAFYGLPFQDQDGKVYVYKEPALTQLTDICERLKSIFGKKFRGMAPDGQPSVQLLMESKVDQRKLNPRLAYVQVTHVKPYFDSLEEIDRQTEFERQHNVSRFSFETPFTKSGSAHSEDISEQWKRRTILRTRHALPFVKKRVEVTDQTERDLSPIEGAIDEIHRKTNEVVEAVSARDSNLVQLRLGGIVNVQVNAGPIAYAEAFLDREKRSNYPVPQVTELKTAFIDLLSQCWTALKLNNELISSTLLEYHNTMVDGFHKLKTRVSELIEEDIDVSNIGGYKDDNDHRLIIGSIQGDVTV